MIKEFFEEMDRFRKWMSPPMEEKLLEEREQQLGICFPKHMKDFYEHFGNDKRAMQRSYYVMHPLQNIALEEGYLCIGYTSDYNGKVGFKIKELNEDFPAVYIQKRGSKTWEMHDDIDTFFLKNALKAVMDTMGAQEAKAVDLKLLDEHMPTDIHYMCDDEVFLTGNTVPVISDKYLGYLDKNRWLHLAAQNQEDVLKFLLDIMHVEKYRIGK